MYQLSVWSQKLGGCSVNVGFPLFLLGYTFGLAKGLLRVEDPCGIGIVTSRWKGLCEH